MITHYVLYQNTHTVWSVIDFHAYGNMWMHPYGNTVDSAGDVCERADDHDDMVCTCYVHVQHVYK